MTPAQELVAAVRAGTEGTPYVLTETATGFDVQMDLEDVAWHGFLYEQHLSRTWIYHVVLDEGRRTLAITDDVHGLSWRASLESADGLPVPVLGASMSRELGRVEGKTFQATWEPGAPGKDLTVVHQFSSATGRDLIRRPARQLGWKEKRSLNEKIGLYVGVTTIVLLVLGGIGVGIFALMGGF